MAQAPESISLTDETRNIIRYGRRATYAFPEKKSEIYQGRIRFAVHEARPLSLDTVSVLENSIDNVASPNEEKKRISDVKSQAVEKQLLRGVSYKLSQTAPIVDMYIPISLTFNEGVSYENANLGVLGGAALGAASEGSSLTSGAMSALEQGLNDVFGFMRSGFASEGARLGALRLSKGIPNAGLQNAVSLGVQRTLNPNTRALFKGVNLRQFNFTFKMIAESQREAIMVEKIVEHFRTELYPDIVSEGEFPVAFKFPHAFSIQFNYGGQEAKLPRLERCFLQGVDTVYNATSQTFHADGRPTEVDMTLRFLEMRALNRKDVERGL